jgi:hypothetical protein
MVAATGLSIGDKVQTLGYYSAGDGGGNVYEIVAAATGTADGGSFIDLTGISGQAKGLFVDGVVNVKQFGAKGDGTDATPMFRAAAGLLKTIGGGTLYIPNGDYPLDTDDSPAWCVRIPKDTSVIGERGARVYRLVPNKKTFLFVNEGADTAGGYTADGNIRFEGFFMAQSIDGTEITETEGDLIAVGHAENIIVKNMRFGKHAQHCIDIGGCKNVWFVNNQCANDNGANGGYAANSDVQVDSASAAAFTGLLIDGTECENIWIVGNEFVSSATNEVVHIGHNGGFPKNVFVLNNKIVGSTRGYAKGIRCDADGASIENLVIDGNIFEMTTANNTAIFIVTNANAGESIKGVKITNNIIRGLCRIGIDVGASDSYTGADYPAVEDFEVSGNTIDIDCTGSSVANAGIEARIIKGVSISNNKVKVKKDTDSSIETWGITVVNCQGSVSGNRVEMSLTTYTGTKDTGAINLSRFGSVATSSFFDVTCESNDLNVDQTKYGIAARFLSISDSSCLLSRNRFRGQLRDSASGAHIYESIASSDGTNGLRPVDFGGGVYSLTVAPDTLYTVSTGLIKKGGSGVRSKDEIRLNLTTGGVSGLANNTETIVVGDSGDTGIQIKNINATTGTFDIAVATGVTYTVQPGSTHSRRVSATITAQAGI